MTTQSTRLILLAAAMVLLASSGAKGQVLVMAPSAAPLTKEQVSNLYLGRSNDFKLIDLPEHTPLRDAFYKKATAREPAQVKSIWSRIIFTGKGQPPTELADAAAVKKAVAADAKTIGYIDKASVDGTVKVVLSLE